MTSFQPENWMIASDYIRSAELKMLECKISIFHSWAFLGYAIFFIGIIVKLEEGSSDENPKAHTHDHEIL